tara:strand:+ start:288 stop:506 length:219 start_codon:yes stop_codon:yes gene_type:complete
MSKSNTFYKNLSKLRSRVKERRRQELYDMINDENNKLEDKIALIKMSFKELESQELVNSFKDMIKTDDSKKE